MAMNNVKKICVVEGIRQSQLSKDSGVGYKTINDIWNQKKNGNDVTQGKVVKAINNISKKDYSLISVFPKVKNNRR